MPSVKRIDNPKHDAAVEKGVARIMAIINGPKAEPVKLREPTPAKVAAPPPLRVVPKEPLPAVHVAPEPAPVAPEHDPVAEQPAIEAAPRRKGPVPKLGKPVMIRLCPGSLDRLKAVAAAHQQPHSTMARNIIEEAFACVPLPAKPVVPVTVLLASIEAGKGLHEFVAELIQRGLGDWQRENAR